MVIPDILAIISEYETPHEYYKKIKVIPKIYTLQKYEKLQTEYIEKQFEAFQPLYKKTNQNFLNEWKQKFTENKEVIDSHRPLFRGYFGREVETDMTKKIKYKPLYNLINPYKEDIINHADKNFVELLKFLRDANIIDTTILLNQIQKSGVINNKVILGIACVSIDRNIKVGDQIKIEAQKGINGFHGHNITINGCDIKYMHFDFHALETCFNLYYIIMNTERLSYVILIKHLKTGELW